MDEMDLMAMKKALANIKGLAKRSVVDRYKAKKAAKPVEVKEEPSSDEESPAHEADPMDEAEDAAEGEAEKPLTEIIVRTHNRSHKDKNMSKAADEMIPPVKRKRGRPPKNRSL